MNLQEKKAQIDAAFIKLCEKALREDKEFINNYVKQNYDGLSDSLCLSLKHGIDRMKDCQNKGGKGPLVYVQLSFLLSGLYSGEQKIKIDFYDEHLYGDPSEIDCFWNYECLFPHQSDWRKDYVSSIQKEVNGAYEYEIRDRFPAYTLGQMQLMQDTVTALAMHEKVKSLLLEAAEQPVQILYGVYMGSFQKICTLNMDKRKPA